MPFYRTQATVHTIDNVAANFATNTWSFEADDVTTLGLCHTALANFYSSYSPQMGNFVLGVGGLTMKSYDNADPMPRAPVLETTHTLVPDSTASLPPEISLVLSFQAERESGVPQSRKRGRVYMPFPKSSTNGTDGRPAAGIIAALDSAATALLAASTAAAGWDWLVYSPTTPGWSLVDNGWVDNEWDIQRRRGRKPLTRSVFP